MASSCMTRRGDYFPEYMAAVNTIMEKHKKENAFFNKVWLSMEKFAKVARPLLGRARRRPMPTLARPMSIH